jgi:guanylate kinase
LKKSGNRSRTLNKRRKKLIFVISSPSGGGKTTLVQKVLTSYPDFFYSISLSTRAKRPGEQNGIDYNFVTMERFKKLIAQKKLAEWAVVHGHYYGTLNKPIMRHNRVLLDIDVQGAKQIKKAYPGAILVFILPPSLKELKRRLIKRHTDNREEIKKRLNIVKKELRALKCYDYAVINRDLNQAFKELNAIILAESLKIAK